MNTNCQQSDSSGRWCSGVAAAHVTEILHLWKEKGRNNLGGGFTACCEYDLSVSFISWSKSLTQMGSRMNDGNDILTPNGGFDPISQTEIIPQSWGRRYTSSNTAFYRERNGYLLVPPSLHLSQSNRHILTVGGIRRHSVSLWRDWKEKRRKRKGVSHWLSITQAKC